MHDLIYFLIRDRKIGQIIHIFCLKHQIMIEHTRKSYCKLPLPSAHISQFLAGMLKYLHEDPIISFNQRIYRLKPLALSSGIKQREHQQIKLRFCGCSI